jgi:hypothetical protein
MERWNFLYEFYNVKNPTFWLIEFPITCIVAAGNSTLQPHVNYQMSISVALFLFKLVYICFRRPFIDWITDIIQAVMALVSLVAINMTFFSRHGVFEKVPALSVSFSVIIVLFLALALIGMIGMVVILLMRPAGQAERNRQRRAKGVLGEAFDNISRQIVVPESRSVMYTYLGVKLYILSPSTDLFLYVFFIITAAQFPPKTRTRPTAKCALRTVILSAQFPQKTRTRPMAKCALR